MSYTWRIWASLKIYPKSSKISYQHTTLSNDSCLQVYETLSFFSFSVCPSNLSWTVGAFFTTLKYSLRIGILWIHELRIIEIKFINCNYLINNSIRNRGFKRQLIVYEYNINLYLEMLFAWGMKYFWGFSRKLTSLLWAPPKGTISVKTFSNYLHETRSKSVIYLSSLKIFDKRYWQTDCLAF